MGAIAKNIEDYISFSIKVEVDKYIDKEGNEKPKEIELRFIGNLAKEIIGFGDLKSIVINNVSH